MLKQIFDNLHYTFEISLPEKCLQCKYFNNSTNKFPEMFLILTFFKYRIAFGLYVSNSRWHPVSPWNFWNIFNLYWPKKHYKNTYTIVNIKSLLPCSRSELEVNQTKPKSLFLFLRAPPRLSLCLYDLIRS